MAWYCEAAGLHDIESAATRGWIYFLGSMLSHVDAFGNESHHIDRCFSGTDKYNLFEWFSSPVINLSKVDMQSIAWEQVGKIL